MPPSAAVIARDTRILAGYAAGATVLELASAEEVDTATVRRVLIAAGVTPRFVRDPAADNVADCLADPAWLRSEYATKSARLGPAEGEIATEVGRGRDRLYEALHAAGIEIRTLSDGSGVVPARSEAPGLGKSRPRAAQGLGQACELPAGWEAVAVERNVGGKSSRRLLGGSGCL